MEINQLIDKIHNADCIKEMKKLPDECIDLIVTDPPYLINYKTNYRSDKENRFCKSIINDTNPKVIVDFIAQAYRLLKQNSAMYMFCSFDKVDFFKQELQKYFTIKNMIVWVKNNWTMGDLEAQYGKQYELIFYVNKGRRKINGKRLTDVWQFDRITGGEQYHQNEKPIKLIMQCIEKSSNVNDIVLDGFMGSGTTAVACQLLNRHFIGYELDKGYYDICIKRLNGQSNKQIKSGYEQIKLF